MSAPIPVPSPYEEELTHDQKLLKKAKDSPFVPIGITGSVAMLGWGAYNFRRRGNMSTSMYLMHLRVMTQSMVVGAMAMGVTYSLIRDFWYKNGEDTKKK